MLIKLVTRHRTSVECLSSLKCYDTPENNYLFLTQSPQAGIINSNQLAESALPPDLSLSASSEGHHNTPFEPRC